MKATKDKRLKRWQAALRYSMELNVNLSEIARKLGIKRSTFYTLRDRATAPDEATMQNVALAFGCTLSEFEELGQTVLAGEAYGGVFEPLNKVKDEAYGVDEVGGLRLRAAPSGIAPIGSMYYKDMKAEFNNLVMYVTRDDSMAPVFPERSAITVDRGDTIPRTGGVYLIKLGQELALRYIENTPRGVLIKAVSPNVSDIELIGSDADALKVFGRAVASQGLIR